MKTLTKIITLVASISALVGAARAVPTLAFTADGGPILFVEDGSALDSNSAVGVVTYIGGLGSWNINVTTGYVGGTAEHPIMDLSSFNVSSTTSSSLQFGFVADNFGPSAGGLNVAVGGTTTGSVLFNTYVDPFNTTDFVSAQLFLTQGAFSTPAFSNVANGWISLANPYSIYEVATITHNGAGATSFDAYLNVPDGSTTALLLGLGLVGLRLTVRRRKGA